MEEIKDKTVCVNIQNYTGEKPVEVIIRKGEAANAVEPLPTKAPIKTNIEGVITSPIDWLEKRVSMIDQKKAHVEVNREDMTILLVVAEDDEYAIGKVKGKVEFTEIYTKTKINNDRDAWIPDRLGQAKSEIQKQKDPNGSRAEVFKQEVESNLPHDFTLNLAIFKGTPKVPIVVEFDHYLADGDCYLQLVSPGANEAVEQFRDRCIDDVLERIIAIAPDIAIMEI